MNAQEVLNGLRRYLSESENERRVIAAKMGVSWITLSAWLADEAEPHKRILARVAGFRRSFNSLRFGDQIPFSGSYRDGKLELRYYQDPGLEIGQQFPLWLSEFRYQESRYAKPSVHR